MVKVILLMGTFFSKILKNNKIADCKMNIFGNRNKKFKHKKFKKYFFQENEHLLFNQEYHEI